MIRFTLRDPRQFEVKLSELPVGTSIKRSPMAYIREPILQPVPIENLHPTQITVGMREVEDKRKRLQARPPEKIGKFLGNHMIPVVLGPKKRPYIIDHHHLALALHFEGLEHVLVTVVANLSALELSSFWIVLDHHGWVHPYDTSGLRQTFADIPETVADLKDDPYRSLAGALRRLGGFAKESTPFSEFLWADFLRRRLEKHAVELDFKGSLAQALVLAKSDGAQYLPGWSGPQGDGDDALAGTDFKG